MGSFSGYVSAEIKMAEDVTILFGGNHEGQQMVVSLLKVQSERR